MSAFTGWAKVLRSFLVAIVAAALVVTTVPSEAMAAPPTSSDPGVFARGHSMTSGVGLKARSAGRPISGVSVPPGEVVDVKAPYIADVNGEPSANRVKAVALQLPDGSFSGIYVSLDRYVLPTDPDTQEGKIIRYDDADGRAAADIFVTRVEKVVDDLATYGTIGPNGRTLGLDLLAALADSRPPGEFGKRSADRAMGVDGTVLIARGPLPGPDKVVEAYEAVAYDRGHGSSQGVGSPRIVMAPDEIVVRTHFNPETQRTIAVNEKSMLAGP